MGGNRGRNRLIGRFTPGVEVKPHFHKTHSETVYVIEGNGQMVIDGNVVEIKPGTVHFNGAGKVHSVKNTGSWDLIVIQIFAPHGKSLTGSWFPNRRRPHLGGDPPLALPRRDPPGRRRTSPKRNGCITPKTSGVNAHRVTLLKASWRAITAARGGEYR